MEAQVDPPPWQQQPVPVAPTTEEAGMAGAPWNANKKEPLALPEPGKGDADLRELAREERRKNRVTPYRWAPEEVKIEQPGLVTYVPPGLAPNQRREFVWRMRIDEIGRMLDSEDYRLDPDRRSPSPTPEYDGSGKRTNTREQRARQALLNERTGLMEKAKALNPNFVAPADFKPVKQRSSVRLPIPYKEYPDYNFIGLIIGPRGNTQKRLERETGARISIRGKGSTKEGKSRRDGKSDPSDNEPLHVLVQADDEETLRKAAAMVKKLLVPIDDAMNEHKRAQLRELALINGTLRDDDYCRFCGKPDHKAFQCPNRVVETPWATTNVRCTICGDRSHPTPDCPRRGQQAVYNRDVQPDAHMDEEFSIFMKELSGQDQGEDNSGGPGAPAPPGGVPPPVPWQHGNAPGSMGPPMGPPPGPGMPPPGWMPPQGGPAPMVPQPGPPMPWGAPPPAPPGMMGPGWNVGGPGAGWAGGPPQPWAPQGPPVPPGGVPPEPQPWAPQMGGEGPPMPPTEQPPLPPG